MNCAFTESVVEEVALARLGAGGGKISHGPGIGPVQLPAQRAGYGEWMLAERFIRRIDS